MDLHYSQTPSRRKAPKRWFYYLMDLHYSQTLFRQLPTTIMFYYLMDLHYSQTSYGRAGCAAGFTTLWIYTILKRRLEFQCPLFVLLPYGFTLFSNYYPTPQKIEDVLLPYGFTLFSNNSYKRSKGKVFYYLMDLHYSQTLQQQQLSVIWFYYLMDLHYSQTAICTFHTSVQFYYLMDLHYSQTLNEE